MSPIELVALVCCDLGSIVRGRSLATSELAAHLDSGVTWVPANHSLTPLGGLAEQSPFGSTGDLRLLPDPASHVRLDPAVGSSALELVLCDIVEIDGRPWECCPRAFLRAALAELEEELGLRALVSFEHEFQLLSDAPAGLPFSLEAQRRAGAFPGEVMGALLEAGVEPERFMPEFGAGQFEIPVSSAEGVAGADRAVVLREIVREVARREGVRASFSPLVNPTGPGNGVHVHLSLLQRDGGAALYDASGSGCLSELGGRFAAGILDHARALSAVCAPSPISAARTRPHRWSAGAVCLAAQNREALLRIPPLVSIGESEPASQMRLEYRGADAAANPYIALGAIVRAGLDGVRRKLPAPAILDRDPSLLDEAEAAVYRVDGLPASLEESLAALAHDDAARGWMPALLYDAFVGVKRAEITGVAELDLDQECRRYADVY